MKTFIFTGPSPLILYAAGSDVRAFALNMDHQYGFISGESRIQSIDYDASKGMFY